MARPSDAKQRMIDTASDLFRRRGYHGVGLAELLVESGAPKGSFYHHFPEGKEALAVEVLSHAGGQMNGLIDHCFTTADAIQPAIAMICEKIARLSERSDFEIACPVVTIASDTAAASETLRQAAASEFRRWTDTVARHAQRLGAGPDEAEILAQDLLVALEGAWLVAKIYRSAEPIRRISERFKG